MFTRLLVLHEIIAQDCWWTGCQPNTWAVTGCANYNREERGKTPCNGNGGTGFKYKCCSGSGGGQVQGPAQPRKHTRRRGKGLGKKRKGSGGGSFVTFTQFKKAVTSNGYGPPSKQQYRNFNKYARSVGKITSKQEAAMALAQLLHESDGLKAKREYACAQTNCPTSYRTPGCDAPGQFYYGRGYIQLTWCGNYRSASQAIFGDQRLVRDPDQVARDDAIAWRTSFWYWGTRVHAQPGVTSGRFGATTKAINGALECSSPGNQKAQKRFQIYGKVRRAFGLRGAGDASGCA